MTDAELMAAIDAIGQRFAGVEIRRQWPTHSWHAAWRARLICHKNQAAEYRFAAFAATWQDAARALIAHVASMDGAR